MAVGGDALFGKDVTDRFVYHYTKRETALEKILPTGKIMLNVLKKTNDPREYLDWAITVTGGSEDNAPLFRTLALINENRKQKTKVFCMTLDDMQRRRQGLMRRGFARSRMWAQYGEGHKGLCLIFDKSALEAEIQRAASGHKNCYCGPVQYSDQNFDIEFNFDSMGETESAVSCGVDSFIRSNVDQLFFTKLLDWRDEMEYRAMIYDDRPNPVFADIDSCLKGVILGPEFPAVYFPIIQQFGIQYSCQLGQLKWLDGEPGYVNLLDR